MPFSKFFTMSSGRSSQVGFVRTWIKRVYVKIKGRYFNKGSLGLGLGSQGLDISRINTLISCRLRHLMWPARALQVALRSYLSLYSSLTFR